MAPGPCSTRAQLLPQQVWAGSSGQKREDLPAQDYWPGVSTGDPTPCSPLPQRHAVPGNTSPSLCFSFKRSQDTSAPVGGAFDGIRMTAECPGPAPGRSRVGSVGASLQHSCPVLTPLPAAPPPLGASVPRPESQMLDQTVPVQDPDLSPQTGAAPWVPGLGRGHGVRLILGIGGHHLTVQSTMDCALRGLQKQGRVIPMVRVAVVTRVTHQALLRASTGQAQATKLPSADQPRKLSRGWGATCGE